MNNIYNILFHIINISLAVTVLIFMITLFYVIYLHTFRRNDIQKNWSENKCNMFIFPFSHLYTDNPYKNIEECSIEHNNSVLAIIKEPIFIIINIFRYIMNHIHKTYEYTKENYGDSNSKANTNTLKPLKFKKQILKEKKYINNT